MPNRGKTLAIKNRFPAGTMARKDGTPFVVTGGTGDPGAPGGSLPAGTNTGDLIRYNAATGAWEVKAEPFAFAGLVLTPALASLVDAEGAIYYDSATKSVKVCTDI